MILRALNCHQQTKFHQHKLKQHQYTQQNLAANPTRSDVQHETVVDLPAVLQDAQQQPPTPKMS